MNSNRMWVVYTLLTLCLVCSAAALAFQVRHFVNEREDPTAQFDGKIKQPDDIMNKLKQDEAQRQRDLMLTFSQTKSFIELATPVPMPSPTPIPPPSPTPVVPAKNWKIEMVMNSMAILQKYDGSSVVVKPGQEVEDAAFGNFTILELNQSAQSVKVKHVGTGTVRDIVEPIKQ